MFKNKRSITYLASTFFLIFALEFSQLGFVNAQILNDTLGLQAARAFNELEPLREFYDWYDWSRNVQEALGSNRSIPTPPTANRGVQEIAKRVEKLSKMIADMGVPPEIPDIVPGPTHTEQGLRNHQRFQELRLQKLREGRDRLNEIQKMLSDVRTASDRIGTEINNALARGRVIDFMNLLQYAVIDFKINIPNVLRPIIEQAKQQYKAVDRAEKESEAKYREFDRKVEEFLRNPPTANHRQPVRDHVNGVAGQNKPLWGVESRTPGRSINSDDTGGSGGSDNNRGGSEGSRGGGGSGSGRGGGGRGGRGRDGSIINNTLGRVEVSTVYGPVEVRFIPPSMDLRRPPERAPILIPSGGEILIMSVFPGPEITIRILAKNEKGDVIEEINPGSGYCGGYPWVTWKNETDETLILSASAYDETGAALRFSNYDVYDELAVLGWGYSPPVHILPGGPEPSPERRNGKPHEAVLVMARADDTNFVPMDKGEGNDSESVELGTNGEWYFMLGFTNVQTKVEFEGRNTLKGPFEFFHPRGNPIIGEFGTDVRRNFFRTGEGITTISFKASVLGTNREWHTIKWQKRRINTALWIYTAGFKVEERPYLNQPQRAVLVVVQKGICPDEERTNILHTIK
ncbi:MAG TPA: hypothetical protein VF648_05900 [Pyrinomonadaceae bacterium]